MTPDTATRLRAQHRARRHRWTLPKGPLGIALLFLVGVLVLLYPTISRWSAQYHQPQHNADYARAVAPTARQHRAEELGAARRYDGALPRAGVADASARL